MSDTSALEIQRLVKEELQRSLKSEIETIAKDKFENLILFEFPNAASQAFENLDKKKYDNFFYKVLGSLLAVAGITVVSVITLFQSSAADKITDEIKGYERASKASLENIQKYTTDLNGKKVQLNGIEILGKNGKAAISIDSDRIVLAKDGKQITIEIVTDQGAPRIHIEMEKNYWEFAYDVLNLREKDNKGKQIAHLP